MRSVTGDGNDAWTVYRMMLEAADHARSGCGPVFLEFLTYRWREHCGPHYDNDLGYRSVREFEEWKARDPVTRMEKELSERGILTAENLGLMDASISEEVERGFRFAEESPFPSPEDAFTRLFSE